MSVKSSIEWTRTLNADGTFTPGTTWSPITGCTKKSEGCRNCWAKHEVETRWSKNPRSAFFGRAFSDIRCHPDQLQQPIRQRKGRRIFVCPRADLFHEEVPFEFIAAVFGSMALAQRHTFQVLTKRPDRMLEFFTWLTAQTEHKEAWVASVNHAEFICGEQKGTRGAERCHVESKAIASYYDKAIIANGGRPHGSFYDKWPLPNVWLGVSVEDQSTADERIPMLLKAPAAVRWLSLEPLLGAIDLELLDCMGGPYRKIDWIVLGGESGDDARPMHPEWVREIQQQCHYARVPFFFKQWGEWLPISEMEDSGEHLYEPVREGKPSDSIRRCRVATRAIGYDAAEHWQVVAGNPSYLTFKVGKRAAGHRIDGKVYHQFPGSIQ